jgi:hypothetical protein
MGCEHWWLVRYGLLMPISLHKCQVVCCVTRLNQVLLIVAYMRVCGYDVNASALTSVMLRHLVVMLKIVGVPY